jgi:hypothetical protein
MQHPRQPEASAADTASPVTPGLRVLIRGAEANPVADAQPASAPAKRARNEMAPVAGVLLVADAALVAWPVVWVLQQKEAVGIGGFCACIVSVTIGAVAGTLAAKLGFSRED